MIELKLVNSDFFGPSSYEVEGDKLYVQGDEYDLSQMQDGDILDYTAFGPKMPAWFHPPITKVGSKITVTVIVDPLVGIQPVPRTGKKGAIQWDTANSSKAQRDKAAVDAEALGYLASTDFYALREFEGGKPIPPDVKAKRAQARAQLNRASA